MKTLKQLLYLCLFASTISYFGCSKDRIEERSLSKYDSKKTNDYMDSKQEEEQEFEITGPGDCPLKGKRGTKICGGKECLEFANGDSVSWPFTLKLVELYKPKDMIYYRMPTVAGGTILNTAGEIRLRAFKNNQELLLKADPCLATVELKDSTTVKNDMRVFYGFSTSTNPDWTDDAASLGVTTSLSPIFTATPYGYSASIAKLGWINCGKTIGSAYSSTVSFTSTTDDLENVSIFIYIPDINTVMQVYKTVSGNIPNGSAIKIIAIAVNAEGKLFSYSDYKVINSNTSIDVKLTETTDAALTSLLDGL